MIVKTSFRWNGKSSGEVPSKGYRAVTWTPTDHRSLGGVTTAVDAAFDVAAVALALAAGGAVRPEVGETGDAVTGAPGAVCSAEAALILKTSKNAA